MSESADNLNQQLSAFQKIWMDTFTRLMQTAFASPPDAAPPELLRQMRSGIFQALAQSWDEYLRSPQFAEGMKQWMDSAIYYRKMTNDLLTRAHHETQDVARQDIDSVLLAVRHLEKRLLDRMEELSARIDEVKAKSQKERSTAPTARQRKPAASSNGITAANSPKTSPGLKKNRRPAAKPQA